MLDRIIVAGDWAFRCYEAAFSQALTENGVAVIPFKCLSKISNLAQKLQLRVPQLSWLSHAMNQELIELCRTHKPDAVLFWRPTLILPDTIKAINSCGILTVSYNNDDPFHHLINRSLPRLQYRLWSQYLRCLPHFGFNFFYRRVNCEEAKFLGGVNNSLLYPYFIPESDKPVELTPEEHKRFDTDVVFAGHFEDDGRDKFLAAIIKSGVRLRLWGGKYWRTGILRKMGYTTGLVTPVIGRDYAAALCGAKVCLAFLSKLNRDTFTRRCFEIPACGRVLLAERTPDLRDMFDEDREACFFSSIDELLEKITWLLSDETARSRIAAAGLRRVWKDGHDSKSRAKEFLAQLGVRRE
jgi:spore maturation protein CgeB